MKTSMFVLGSGLCLATLCIALQYPATRQPLLTEATPQVHSIAYTNDGVQLANVPFIKKKPDFAGEACVAMAIQAMGHDADQDFVFDQGGIDPVLGRGLVARELKTAIEKIGFRPGPVWTQWSVKSAASFWKNLQHKLRANRTSIFCIQEDDAEKFVLVVGVDTEQETVVVHDPSLENGKNRKWKQREFFSACQLAGDLLVEFEMDLNTDIRIPNRPVRTNADYAQHIIELKKKLPGDDFTIVLQKPFVVIGNNAPERVNRWAVGTVKWAVDMLKKDYFSKDPVHIIDIWLFKDKSTYEKNCQTLFGSKPGTPFGYYSSRDRALVMNISTGGGTLVHEIVHPFIESNFPECPSWFNEGLASLYEQCATRDNKIVGLTNWRLRGLQLAIQSDRLDSFETLCKTTRREFYDDPRGTNYAQARYLCYYLQERGLLRKFYREFTANIRRDASGYQTLQDLLATDDMEKFQADWEQYVLKLRFGN